jgi:hypothetical protein
VSKRGATELCNLPVHDRSSEFRIGTPILCALSLILLGMRLAARACGVPAMLGWDDAIITSAWAFAMPITVFSGYMGKFGLGQDIWMVPFGHVTNLLRLFYLCQLFYICCVTLTKVALLLFFLRVFPQRWFKRFCWVMIGIVVAFGVSYIIVVLVQCRPISFNWNSWDGEHTGQCVNLNLGTHINAALNMVMDIVILLMPMPLLVKLHITYSWKQKANILVMFSVGSLVTVVSALRLRTLVVFGKTTNPTWDLASVGLWSIIEIYTGIICACLPATRSFLVHVLPRWLGYTINGSRTGGRATGPRSGASGTGGAGIGASAVSRSKTPTVNTRPLANKGISKGSFSDRSNQGFTELDDLDTEEYTALPMHGTHDGGGGTGVGVSRAHHPGHTGRKEAWSIDEREGSDHSGPASTKQWS